MVTGSDLSSGSGSDSSVALRLLGLGFDAVALDGDPWFKVDEPRDGVTPVGDAASLGLRPMIDDDDVVVVAVLLLETNMKSLSCKRPWKLGSFFERSAAGMVAVSSSILRVALHY